MLSYSQKRIWLLQTLYKDEPIYNISFELLVKDELDILLFDKSVNYLLIRANILRTNIKKIKGEPKLFFNKKKLKTIVIQTSIDNEPKIIEDFINKSFDLEKDLLIRILKINQKIIFSFSDLVIDGFSIINFFKELEIVFNFFLNKKIPLFNYNQKYYDFVINNQNIENDKIAFWKKIIINKDCSTYFPINKINNDINSCKEYRIKFLYSKEKLNQIKDFCNLNKITLFNLFITIIYLIIYDYTKSNFICLDTILGTIKNTKNLIGLFNNTLLLPVIIDASKTIHDFLKNTKQNILSILDNGEIPLEKLVNTLEIKKLPNIRIHFEYSSNDNLSNQVKLGDCQLRSNFFENSSNSIRQLLMFNFGLTEDSLDCFISYKDFCFKRENIIEIKDNINIILNLILENSNLRINDVLKNLKKTSYFNDIYKSNLDLRLLAYKHAGNNNVNFNDFKKEVN